MGARPGADRRGAAARHEARRASASRTTRRAARWTSARLQAIVDVVERHPTARLLVDETYRELAYDAPPLPLAASRSPRAVGVSSLSKAYGLPGPAHRLAHDHRPGASRSCSSRRRSRSCSRARSSTRRWPRACSSAATPSSPACSPPSASAATRSPAGWRGPSTSSGTRRRPASSASRDCAPERGADPEVFHTAALRDHGTYVGPGHWFEQDRRCFRLGFGWPGMDELVRGLDGLTAAARDAERAAA